MRAFCTDNMSSSVAVRTKHGWCCGECVVKDTAQGTGLSAILSCHLTGYRGNDPVIYSEGSRPGWRVVYMQWGRVARRDCYSGGAGYWAEWPVAEVGYAKVTCATVLYVEKPLREGGDDEVTDSIR